LVAARLDGLAAAAHAFGHAAARASAARASLTIARLGRSPGTRAGAGLQVELVGALRVVRLAHPRAADADARLTIAGFRSIPVARTVAGFDAGCVFAFGGAGGAFAHTGAVHAGLAGTGLGRAPLPLGVAADAALL